MKLCNSNDLNSPILFYGDYLCITYFKDDMAKYSLSRRPEIIFYEVIMVFFEVMAKP